MVNAVVTVNASHEDAIPAKAGIQERGSPTEAFGDDKIKCRSIAALAAVFILSSLLTGCSAPVNATIPSIPKNHPANKFYQAAQQGMLSDRVCRDNKGDPAIPAGKIVKGEGYTKLAELTAGVFRFRENATGKEYLGVSFLQYSGFLQIPKVCSWEEKK
ncbi:MAG: hypothetical protein WCJ71_02975 [Candidatus Omnitrophota bacterium]